MIVAIGAGRSASPELRERLALDREGVRSVLRAERPGIRELLVLSTCHRTELYAVAEGPEPDAVHALAGLVPALHPSDQSELFVLRDADAVRHLFRVAAGLDALVVGEPQILGQVRDAHALATEERSAGPILSTVVSRALAVGRDVRRRTALGGRDASIGALTAHMLAEGFGGLEGVRGAVVGAGEAASDVAHALRRYGPSLVVVGRTREPAERLARSLRAEARDLDAMPEVLRESAFAVVAVGAGGIIDGTIVPARRERDPLVLVDLSMPRAVDIEGRDDVDLRTIDDLPAPQTATLRPAIDAAERAVDEAVAAWVRRIDDPTAGRDVGVFRARVEALVRKEIERELARAEVSAEEAERIAAVALRITNKLLHGPSVAMRDADPETRRRILELFEMEG